MFTMDSILCRSVLCVLIVLFSVCTGIEYNQPQQEDTDVADRPFPPWTMVYKRNITCGGSSQSGLKFPAQTWTCADARVNGLRLAYGLYPGIGVDERCTETKGQDELAQICRVLMKSIEVNKPLWAAFVTNATCQYHPRRRPYLNKTVGSYDWNELDKGYGWIETFRCMAER